MAETKKRVPIRTPMQFNVDFGRLFHALNLQIQDVHFPTIAICPLCHKEVLRVYHDTACITLAYFICPICSIADNTVDFVKRVKKFSNTLEAVEYLSLFSECPPQDLERFRYNYTVRRHHKNSFYAITRRKISFTNIDREQLNESLTLHGITPTLITEDDSVFLNQWVKLAPQTRTNLPRPYNVHAYINGQFTLQHRNIQELRNVAFLPLEDMPARIAGVSILSELPDEVILHISPHKPKKRRSDTLATDYFGMYYGLNNMLNLTQDRILVSSFLSRVLNLQLQNHQQCPQMLPLCGISYGIKQSRIIRQLDKQLVFWCDEDVTPAIVRECLGTDSLISREPLPRTGLSIQNKIKTVIDAARPWLDVLTSYLLDKPDLFIKQFVMQLKLHDHQLQQFLKYINPALADKIRHCVFDSNRQLVSFAGRYFVREDNNIRLSSGMLIADVFFDIKYVYKRKSQKVYEGMLKTATQDIPFCVTDRLTKDDHLRWLYEPLANHGIVPYVKPNWRNNLIDFGLLFSNPQYLTQPSRLGWDAEANALITKAYVLNNGGDITPLQLTDADDKFEAMLPTPIKLPNSVLTQFDQHTDKHLYLTLLGYIAYYLLAPRYGIAPIGLTSCCNISQILRWLSVRGVTYHYIAADQDRRKVPAENRNKTHLKSARRFIKKILAQPWPYYMHEDTAEWRRFLNYLFVGSKNISIILYEHNFAAHMYARMHKLYYLPSSMSFKKTQLIYDHGGDFVAAYLHDLATRNFTVDESVSTDLFYCFLHDVQKWWRNYGMTCDLPLPLLGGDARVLINDYFQEHITPYHPHTRDSSGVAIKMLPLLNYPHADIQALSTELIHKHGDILLKTYKNGKWLFSHDFVKDKLCKVADVLDADPTLM